MKQKFSVFSFQFSVSSSLKTLFFALKTKNLKLKTGPRGFTLIELLVVVGIITVITSIVLVSNAKYGGAVLLQNLAYDIALSIRQAQVYGISVRSFNASNFSVGYGMHFAVSDNTHYELFADADNNGLFSDASENVSPSPYEIGRGYKIKSLCATDSGNESCTFDTLDIIFKRPEPDARITARNGSGQTCVQNTQECKEEARVVVESPRGQDLSIVIDATGQISVK